MNNKHYVGKRISSFELYNDIGPITGVALLLDDENELLAGDDSGYMIEVNCPYGTQAIANDILAKLQGKTYKGFRGENAVLDPAAELGDGISANGMYSMLAHRNVTFGPGHMSDISAPGESTPEHEYKWTDPKERAFKRKLAQTQSMISKTAEEIRLEIEAVDGRVSSISQTVDNLSFKVVGADGKTSEIKLSGDGTIDLSGLVTFSALSGSPGSGQTKINGGWIDTDTLTVKNIEIKDGSITWAKLSSGAKDNIAKPSDISDYVESLVEEGTLVTDVTVTEITQDAIKTCSITANQITSGAITAGNLSLKGPLQLDYGQLPYGYVGASNAGDFTGAVLCDDTKTNYFIATRGGARMTSGTSSFYVISDGCYSTKPLQEGSDERLKSNISYDLEDEEKLFMRLQPCSFQMNADEKGKRRWGFIAQKVIEGAAEVGMDVEKLAFIGESDGMYSLAYSQITALNTHMIQKLMARVAELEELYGKQ